MVFVTDCAVGFIKNKKGKSEEDKTSTASIHEAIQTLQRLQKEESLQKRSEDQRQHQTPPPCRDCFEALGCSSMATDKRVVLKGANG